MKVNFPRMVGLILIVGVLAIWWLAGRAQAHALLVRSLPEAGAKLASPPPTIEFWFSEPLESRFSNATLLDSLGTEVATGASMVDGSDPYHMTLPLGELPPGIYTVVWRTLSTIDGHEWVGSFPLTILNADSSVPDSTAVTVEGVGRGELPGPAEGAVRWISLMGAMLLLGALLFAVVAVRFGRDSIESDPLISLMMTPVSVVFLMGAAALVVGGWLQIAVQALALGDLGHLPDLLFATNPGNLIFYRQLLVGACLFLSFSGMVALPQPWHRLFASLGLLYTLVLMAVLGLQWRTFVPNLALSTTLFALAAVAVGLWQWRAGRPLRLGPMLGLLVAAATLATFSLGSHAAAVPGSGWAVLVDFVHLVAAAAWLGGLLLLTGLLWRARRHLTQISLARLGEIIRRFSSMAGLSVFVLALTGLFSSLVQLPQLSDLWTTTYGWLLLAKLCLIGLAMAVALLNNRAVHGNAVLPPAGQLFLRRVLVESCLGLGILVVVALLVQTPVPRVESANMATVEQQFNDILAVDDLLIHVQVSPNTVGNNRYWTHLYHADGSSIGDVQLVRLLFEHQEVELGQARVDLAPQGQDTFAVEGAYFNRAGPWDLAVYVRRRGLDDVITNVTVTVPPIPVASVDRSPWQNPVPGLPAGTVAGGLLLGLGLMPLLWYRPLRRRSGRVYPALATVGAVAMITGGVLAYSAYTTAVPANLTGPPIPVSAESVAAGAALYQSECAACHGEYGLGNGPAAAALAVPPAVLIFHVPQHEDANLYGFISQGFPALGMPAYGEKWSNEQIWQVVHYLRDQFGAPAE